MKSTEQECCPKFDSKKWDSKTFHWEDKPFIKESIPTLFHIPFPKTIGKKVNKMMKLAEEANALSKYSLDDLLLFNDPTAFKSDMYLSVSEKVPGAHNIELSGTFMSKVFEGPYHKVPKFINEMNVFLASKDQKANDYYVHYAYCPKCAKEFGHNYVVLFAELED